MYRSPILQHFFDCPLQFGAAPDFSESTDNAEDAAVAELQVQLGDVLLAGSDGLWDNCFDSEILQMLPSRAEGAEQVIAWAAVYRGDRTQVKAISAAHVASPQCYRPVCSAYWIVTVWHARCCQLHGSKRNTTKKPCSCLLIKRRVQSSMWAMLCTAFCPVSSLPVQQLYCVHYALWGRVTIMQ